MFGTKEHHAESFDTGDWRNTLVKRMGGYLHPVIVNGKQIQDLHEIHQLNNVYVYVDFVKSGRNFYTVQTKD